MSWTPHRSIAPSLANLRSAALMPIGTSFNVLGVALSDVEVHALLEDTLGISPEMDEHAIDAHAAETIARPATLPCILRETMERAGIDEDDMALARHMGVDPVRLMVLGHASVARVESGHLRIRTVPRWEQRRLSAVNMAFTIGKGVTWCNGVLRSNRTQLPDTVRDTLRGRTLDGIVDHGWDGWKRLRVKRAEQSGTTLVIHTARQAEVSLATL